MVIDVDPLRGAGHRLDPTNPTRTTRLYIPDHTITLVFYIAGTAGLRGQFFIYCNTNITGTTGFCIAGLRYKVFPLECTCTTGLHAEARSNTRYLHIGSTADVDL